jgi:hypothetical protein
MENDEEDGTYPEIRSELVGYVGSINILIGFYQMFDLPISYLGYDTELHSSEMCLPC